MSRRAAAADGLSKLTRLAERPRVAEVIVAGDDFLTCCGDDLGPSGEKAAWPTEKGVETPGVGAAPCEGCDGVLPCDSAFLPGVGVDMVVVATAESIVGKIKDGFGCGEMDVAIAVGEREESTECTDIANPFVLCRRVSSLSPAHS
jgi:hypothetical protein